MSRPTRLILLAPNGDRITDDHGTVAMDLTGFPNVNGQAPLVAGVEQFCDLGHWHPAGHTSLPFYDTADQPGEQQ